jgi:2-oxoglutarate ferredoxin oxidoreductase subunit alpha
MTPVVLLTDGFIGNSSEPWRVAEVSKLEKIQDEHPTKPNDAKGFLPYKRNADGARPWALPGTPGLEHRVGGLEKVDGVGTVSHDPANHDKMVNLRAAKVAGIKPAGKPYLWEGPESGDVLLLGWGGTYGHIKAATMELRRQGVEASACQLRYINPLPEDLGEKLKKFKQVILPENNLGQLRMWLRAKYLIDIKGFNRVRGQPFTVHELVEGVRAALASK